jgi:hypothetical protein
MVPEGQIRKRDPGAADGVRFPKLFLLALIPGYAKTVAFKNRFPFERNTMSTFETLIALVVIAGAYTTVGFIAHAWALSSARRRLAERSLSVEQIEVLMKGTSEVAFSLRMALIAFAVGIGLVLVQILPEDLRDQPIALAMIFLLAGLGFLVHHRMAKRSSG